MALVTKNRLAFCLLFSFGAVSMGMAQHPQQTSSNLLPYSFSNFVWWTDSELRGLLKRQIPGLEDEIAPSHSAEAPIRGALKRLLQEKGIVADIQTEEPSAPSLTSQRVPGAPSPSIVFSVLSPEITVEKVLVSGAPPEVASQITEALHNREGREYSARQDWLVRSTVIELVQSKGYLSAKTEIAHDQPKREGTQYSVNLLVSVTPGMQYRIGTITADGGPLLTGKELSSSFGAKAGDVAVPNPFGRLAGQIRALYWQHGYADVSIDGGQSLDPAHGLASYHLSVQPGPVYYLRSIEIYKLTAEQERRVRELLQLKAGDIWDQMALSAFQAKLRNEPELKGYGFTFSPKKDQQGSSVDLSLDFFQEGSASSVTIR